MRNLSTHRFVQKYWLKRLCLNELAIWFTFGKTQIILPKALAHYSNGRCCIELQSISGLLHSMKNAITRVRLNSGSNKFWSSIRGIYWNLLEINSRWSFADSHRIHSWNRRRNPYQSCFDPELTDSLTQRTWSWYLGLSRSFISYSWQFATKTLSLFS